MCLASNAEAKLSLIALAQGARMYKLSRPRMTNENVIKIDGGR